MSQATPFAQVTGLIVMKGGAAQARYGAPSGGFAVLSGNMADVLATGASEQTAVLAALAKLPTGNTITISGGTYGGTSDTVANHTTRVTG